MIRATLLTCLLSVGVVAAQERPAGILDLTMETIAVADLRSGGGVGISEQDPHAVEVSFSMDKSRYRTDEEFSYEIKVRNISGKDLEVPWRTDGPTVVMDPPKRPSGFLYASVGLENHGTHHRSVVALGLYGSNEAPSSKKTLRPGDFVLIRGVGSWDTYLMYDKWLAYGPVDDSQRERTVNVNAYWRYKEGFDDISYRAYADSEKIQIELVMHSDEESNK